MPLLVDLFVAHEIRDFRENKSAGSGSKFAYLETCQRILGSKRFPRKRRERRLQFHASFTCPKNSRKEYSKTNTKPFFSPFPTPSRRAVPRVGVPGVPLALEVNPGVLGLVGVAESPARRVSPLVQRKGHRIPVGVRGEPALAPRP